MSAPRTVAELYRLFEQMKNDFGARLAKLEQSNNSLINEIKEKDVEIKRLKTAEAEAVKQHSVIQKVVDNHQSFLEKTDTYRRERNVVIYGLTESTEVSDADQVKEVLAEMKCEGTVPEKHVRLGIIQDPTNQQTEEGQPQRPPRPRPLLVICKSSGDRNKLLTNTNKLKAAEKFKKVFVKKDQTPHERKEWSRLREVLKREKERPQNQGINVKIDYRTKCVMVGERVVEKGNFRRGPEW